MSWKKKLTTGAVLASLTAGTIYTINKIISFTSTLDNLLCKEDGHYFDWRFGKIFYRKQGEGKPILLIHDLTVNSSSHEWNKLVKSLKKRNTVYTIDLLGCGHSEKPNLTYTNFLYVQLLTDFIKTIIGEKTDVIATGTSSSFVLMACANDDSLFDRIMMINPTNLSTLATIPTKRTKLLRYLLLTPLIGTFLYNILMSKRLSDQNFFEENFHNPEALDVEIKNYYYESSHLDSSHGKYLLGSILGRYTNANMFHALKNINNSIFLIASTGSGENIAIAEQYRNYIPSIEITTLKDSVHFPQLETPQTLLEQIDLFLGVEEES